jgi:hypothetical protein
MTTSRNPPNPKWKRSRWDGAAIAESQDSVTGQPSDNKPASNEIDSANKESEA